MAKKPENDPEQYKRFLAKVKELEDAGELNPIEANEKFDRSIKRILPIGNSHND